jgi:hypothetical protein
MKTTHLPWFDPARQEAVRARFKDRIPLATTPEARQALNDEYKAALNDAERELEADKKNVSKGNVEAFLADPQGVLDELQEEAGRTFDLGEMLIGRGIAVVTSKRFGKGVFVGKGTDYGQTKSNFMVKAVIGSHTLNMEMMSGNERHQKESMHSHVAATLARNIAAGKA